MSIVRAKGPAIGLILLAALSSLGWAPLTEADRHCPEPAPVITRSVLSSGGSPGAGPAWIMNGTLGQATPPMEGFTGDLVVRTGFWAWLPGVTSGMTLMSSQTRGDYLFQNTPNPFRASTRIDYALSGDCVVKISVFDVHGREVRTLAAEDQGPGRYTVTWNGLDEGGRSVSPGIYFFRLETDSHRIVRKMVHAR